MFALVIESQQPHCLKWLHIYSDHQSLRNFCSLAEKIPRVQRWQDFWSAYSFTLRYKPGPVNANADMLSRLPKDYSEEDASGKNSIANPDDVDVYFIGASGVQPRLFSRPDSSSLDGLRPKKHSSSLDGLRSDSLGGG